MSPRHFAGALLLGASLSAQGSPGEHFAFGHPADAAQATRTVEVTLGDIYFEPKSLDVKKGETVRFVLVNKGQLLHEFNLGDAAMHAAHQQEMLKMTAKRHAHAYRHEEFTTWRAWITGWPTRGAARSMAGG